LDKTQLQSLSSRDFVKGIHRDKPSSKFTFIQINQNTELIITIELS